MELDEVEPVGGRVVVELVDHHRPLGRARRRPQGQPGDQHQGGRRQTDSPNPPRHGRAALQIPPAPPSSRPPSRVGPNPVRTRPGGEWGTVTPAPRPSSPAAPRVGLVLGAGGLVGQAYQAGVLAALEHDLGWDPRTAEVVVGSSAGSITATLLRLGVPASDLAAFAVEAPLSLDGRLLDQLGAEPPAFAPFALRDLLRPWHLPSPALLARTARRPWAFRPSVAALTLVPDGKVDIEGEAEALASATEGAPGPTGCGSPPCAAATAAGSSSAGPGRPAPRWPRR
ncbi:MAG TPA: patatin-like phospholipase family protein [Iamia sp.]|nr:patatin-like phospholipase family protein [Iamia sp.]